MDKYRLAAIAAVTTLLVGAAVAWTVVPGRVANSAAQATAQRFVDYVATGTPDDMQRLWAMTATEEPGALRSAGQLLVAAEERIEVLSVGDPSETERSSTPYQTSFADFVAIDVRYRLAGKEHDWPLVLAKLDGESGTDVADWRIVEASLGSIDWTRPGFADVASDLYVSDVRQVRRPAIIGSSEDVQLLYPARYLTQSRLDPYYTSEPLDLDVTAGEPVAPADLRLAPTQRTQDRVRRQVLARFASCGTAGGSFGQCPAEELVESRGVDTYARAGWWLGLGRAPEIVVDLDGVTLSGGTFRFRGPDGVRRVTFDGTGRYVLDNQSWTPVLVAVDIEETD